MNTAVINVKTSSETKEKAKQIAHDFGLNLSSMINALLHQVIQTKTLTLSASDEEPTDYLLQVLEESKEDIKAGRVIPFKQGKDALSYLDELIEDDLEHKKN